MERAGTNGESHGAGLVAQVKYDNWAQAHKRRTLGARWLSVRCADYLSRLDASLSSSASRMTSHAAATTSTDAPLVGVIMGSRSDLRIMSTATELLTELGIAHEVRIVSAHRTPDWMFEYARTAEGRGIAVIIAAAGGAAHLPGMVAACTILPVLGVPIPATQLNGVDALLSIVQMPRGVPVGTLAIGEPGAANAALLAASILAGSRPELRERLRAWRDARSAAVLADTSISGPPA